MFDDSFPYKDDGNIDEGYKEELLKLVYDNIPKRGNGVVISMTYNDEYDNLEVRIFRK